MTTTSLVWFRSDLRLSDNPALTTAAKQGPFIPIYILDENSPVRPRGSAQKWWLHHSLLALSKDFKKHGCNLILKRGSSLEILKEIAQQTGITSIFWNKAFTPDQANADKELGSHLREFGITTSLFDDGLLSTPGQPRTQQNKDYTVFTPYWNALKASQIPYPIGAPQNLTPGKYKIDTDSIDDWNLLPKKPNWSKGFSIWTPGEAAAQHQLDQFLSKKINGYTHARDRPDKDATSQLSPHLALGEITPRQIWHATLAVMETKGGRLDSDGWKFLSELGWREFSAYLLYYFPNLPTQPFRPRFQHFPWKKDLSHLTAWQKGRTGYPIIDAGMRQLWHTGWMHNRVRMIVASFLCKHLLTHWIEGEAWFWDTLVDADMASNTANWQWVAGSGADAAPYFRIFNPILQGEKFDPQGHYVRQWIPELAQLENSIIHTPWQATPAALKAANIALGKTYPFPIVDHAKARKRALTAYSATALGDDPGQLFSSLTKLNS